MNVPGIVRNSTPFLSVILRTQEGRRAFLMDALLSLAAQSCSDFEVVVMAHDVGEPTARVIEETLGEFDPEFSRRVRCERVGGGGRARAFNTAIRSVRGEYVACMDDNVVAFGHWVETVRKFAKSEPGRVVRTRVATQSIEPMCWDDWEGYMACTGVSTPFPEMFEFWTYVFEDMSPKCGFAFPRDCLDGVLTPFDESLHRGEEKEVVARSVLRNGVVDAGEVTTLERTWHVNDPSDIAKEADEWNRTRSVLVSKLDRLEILAPVGTVSALDEFRRARSQADAQLAEIESDRIAVREAFDRLQTEHDAVLHSTSWRITRPLRVVSDLFRRTHFRAR